MKKGAWHLRRRKVAFENSSRIEINRNNEEKEQDEEIPSHPSSPQPLKKEEKEEIEIDSDEEILSKKMKRRRLIQHSKQKQLKDSSMKDRNSIEKNEGRSNPSSRKKRKSIEKQQDTSYIFSSSNSNEENSNQSLNDDNEKNIERVNECDNERGDEKKEEEESIELNDSKVEEMSSSVECTTNSKKMEDPLFFSPIQLCLSPSPIQSKLNNKEKEELAMDPDALTQDIHSYPTESTPQNSPIRGTSIGNTSFEIEESSQTPVASTFSPPSRPVNYRRGITSTSVRRRVFELEKSFELESTQVPSNQSQEILPPTQMVSDDERIPPTQIVSISTPVRSPLRSSPFRLESSQEDPDYCPPTQQIYSPRRPQIQRKIIEEDEDDQYLVATQIEPTQIVLREEEIPPTQIVFNKEDDEENILPTQIISESPRKFVFSSKNIVTSPSIEEENIPPTQIILGNDDYCPPTQKIPSPFSSFRYQKSTESKPPLDSLPFRPSGLKLELIEDDLPSDADHKEILGKDSHEQPKIVDPPLLERINNKSNETKNAEYNKENAQKPENKSSSKRTVDLTKDEKSPKKSNSPIAVKKRQSLTVIVRNSSIPSGSSNKMIKSENRSKSLESMNSTRSPSGQILAVENNNIQRGKQVDHFRVLAAKKPKVAETQKRNQQIALRPILNSELEKNSETKLPSRLGGRKSKTKLKET
eukprot:TRINITY_DN2396_c0_g1_i1.p1 TRINITY_DN2396_c0_g1~~TRINITY_DN2396_c0_g1_i1.p1  ORF type:complete len:699 (-),score=219.12 TRINITY_DN2396_c0_g1_i1:47-2143(-)